MPAFIHDVEQGLIVDGGNQMKRTAKMAKQLKADKISVWNHKEKTQITKKQEIGVVRVPNGETEIVHKIWEDAYGNIHADVHVEGPFHTFVEQPKITHGVF